jgi:hypothetical protein
MKPAVGDTMHRAVVRELEDDAEVGAIFRFRIGKRSFGR